MGPTASAEAHARAGALSCSPGCTTRSPRCDSSPRLRPTIVSGAASYLLHLDRRRAHRGYRPRVARHSHGHLRRRAWCGRSRRRASDLRPDWGTFVRDGYGLTELFPLGGGCRHSTALHIASDLVIAEVVDPSNPVSRCRLVFPAKWSTRTSSATRSRCCATGRATLRGSRQSRVRLWIHRRAPGARHRRARRRHGVGAGRERVSVRHRSRDPRFRRARRRIRDRRGRSGRRCPRCGSASS